MQSPCVLICAIEPESGHCYGCGRTRTEIADWTSYTDATRATLMEELPSRVEKLERRPRRVTKRARMRKQAQQRDIIDISTVKS